ncbi:MAG: succinate dehydrogenase cytochrome b subunit [Luteolibacter sp.]|uniref:succinate dehydrogenase cytochrome b subunit n=1 Tax=Luteolibacter sp. TaxID=1962973 RepID=UPI003264C194
MNAITRCLDTYWSSSIGKKLIVAITGIVLVLFLGGHMTGNLLVFVGPEAFNDYAEFLHHLLHGAGIWVARIGLLVAITLHVAATIAITCQNKAARKQYEYQATIQASKSSRIMIWSGLTILAFVIYHLLHFTVRVGNEYNNPQFYTDLAHMAATGKFRQNAWKMVIDGFSVWYVVLFYIISMTLLCSHLSHGVGAIFQTLGLRSKKSASAIDLFSKAYSAVIWLGFVSIPVAIYVFKFGR